MVRRPRPGTVLFMFSSFPAAWVLIALPFISALLISQIHPLRELAATRYRVTWPLGIVGLLLLLAELIGALPAASALPVMFLAGAVSGFSLFWPSRGEERGGSGGAHWRDEPPDDGPPWEPLGGGPLDWERFDRLRAEWGRRQRRPRPSRQ